MKNPEEALRREAAARVAFALSTHPSIEARRWTFRELTRAVAKHSGVAMSEDSGRIWMTGSQPRNARVAAALAAVLEVRAGWLYFGEEPMRESERAAGAFDPDIHVPHSAFPTGEEVDARRAADRQAAAKKAAGGRKRS